MPRFGRAYPLKPWLLASFRVPPGAGSAGILSTAGTGAASFVGASQAAGVLSAAGTGTFTPQGAGVLAASGVGTATFVGAAVVAASFAITGAAAVSPVGASGSPSSPLTDLGDLLLLTRAGHLGSGGF